MAYSLAPFEFSLTPARGAMDPSERGLHELIDVALHALAFAALGAIGRSAFSNVAPTRFATATVLVGGLTACLLIELTQLFVPGRHAQPIDLGVNSLALIGGHVGAARLQRSIGGLSIVLPRGARALLLLMWTLFWSWIVYIPTRLVALDGWNPSYPLLLGNEKATIDRRPWEGTLQFVAIYDRSLSAAEVSALFAQAPAAGHGDAFRMTLGLLTSYDFTHMSGPAMEPTGRVRAPGLVVDIPAAARTFTPLPGVLVGGGTVLESRGAAAPLTSAIAAANAFTVEVWCRPANITQTGPARIVGISESLWSRNFTLAQQADALHFRVRNHLNGENGLNYELRAPGALSADLLQLVATYDRGISRVFRNGSALHSVVNLRQPSVVLGLGTRPEGAVVVAAIAALTLLLILRS